MPKCETKARILYIYKLMLEETDKEHDITIQQIIDRLEGQGISAYRKTVIADIEQLKSFGADIVGVRSSQNRYYMNSRLFSLSEIKLLIDAVECSQFITPSKSAELIEKLSSLASCHNKDKLGWHIYLSQRLKSDNEDMYGVVDSVNTAINLNRQITFQYYEYDAEKNKVLRNGGERYVLSPYGMIWEDGRYYVIGFSVKHDKIITFEVSTQIVSKTTELIMEMIKVAIEKERSAKGFKPKSAVLSGGEVTYQKLKEGGEVTMLPSFAKEDYKAFLKKAKAMDIPVAAIQESGKENTLSLFFNVKDKEAVNSIVQDIVREKLKQPEQTERMITIEKEQVEGFQMYCSEHDIPVNFLETQGGVKCIFGSAYEKQMEVAVENYKNIQSELSQIGTEVEKNVKGKYQIKLTDNEQGKSLTMNFCTRAKLERVLRERMGYSEVKAVEVANSLTDKLTDSQRQYYLSDSRQLGEMDFYETDIKFDDDNLLLENYSFVKLKANGDDEPKLTVTDKSGNFVVLSAKNLDRAEVESKIRSYLKINDSETIKTILDKSERLGFAEQPKQVQYKEFQIERDTQSSFTVRGGSTVVRLDLNNKESAKKQLMDAFGMSAAKADKIIGKAEKQRVANNLLRKAREKVKDTADTIRHKKLDRGARK